MVVVFVVLEVVDGGVGGVGGRYGGVGRGYGRGNECQVCEQVWH